MASGLLRLARDAGPSRPLVLAWLGLAVGAFALSTVFAVMLVVSRLPLPPSLAVNGQAFRAALVPHVDLAVLVWFLSFAAALWNLASTASRMRFRWAGFALAAAGTLAIAAAPFSGGTPWLANYVPVLASPVFFTGAGWFVTGVALAALSALPGILALRRGAEPTPERIGVGLSILPLLTALVSLAWAGYSSAAEPLDPARYENIIWGAGHTIQFTHVTLMMIAWLALAAPLAHRRTAVALLVLASAPSLLAPLFHGLYPAASAPLRAAFTALMTWGLWPGAGGLALLLLAAGWRNRKSARAEGAGGVALYASIGLFALGCVLGSAIRGDSTLVPAHYHCTIGAVTIAYMGLGYRLLPAFGFSAVPSGHAQRQLGLYASGLAVLAAGLAWSSVIGVPRKTAHAELPGLGDAYTAAMILAGVGGLLAVVAAAWFVVNAVRAVGPKSAPQDSAVPRRRRDIRPRAIAITLGLILASGLLFSLLPDRYGAAVAEPPVLTPEAAHAAEMRKQEIESRFGQGVAMLHAKQYDHALTAFHRVLQLNPEMPEAHVNAGFALIGLGRYAEARDFFEGATALRREQLNAYYGLAIALEGLRDLPGAVGAMRTYVHLAKPEDPYLRKARSALWEWEEAMNKERSAGAASPAPRRDDAPPASTVGEAKRPLLPAAPGGR